MSRVVALVALVALLAAAAAAARPAVAAAACPAYTAEVVSDPAAVVDYSAAHPEGVPLKGTLIRRPGHFYELLKDAQLRFRGNVIWATKGSILKLGCYARSKGSRSLPAVDLLRGSLKLQTVQGDPAGVLSEEGLFDPRTDETITFTIKRTLTKRGELTLEQRLKWFANFADQPMGTTTVSSATVMGVTPYVGANPGSCRYVRGATLTTTGGYGKGKASYRP